MSSTLTFNEYIKQEFDSNPKLNEIYIIEIDNLNCIIRERFLLDSTIDCFTSVIKSFTLGNDWMQVEDKYRIESKNYPKITREEIYNV